MLERPFHFIVVLWGERFRGYFLEYLLPSLLTPGNLPSLRTRYPSKLVIATTREDMAILRTSPLMMEAMSYVGIEHVEIPPCPANKHGCEHMGKGHKLASQAAYEDHAYTMFMCPDNWLSDGAVERLQEHAEKGVQLVISPAVRFGEEPFLAGLKELVGRRGAVALRDTRAVVGIALKSMHPETEAYEWDKPGLLFVSAQTWFKVPGEDGIVLHSLTWAILMMDYAALEVHDASTFDKWTLDGDYLYKNCTAFRRIHVVKDSDEIFFPSWGPIDYRIQKKWVPFGHLIAKLQFGCSYRSQFFDPFRRPFLFETVRWHSKPLNEKWRPVEARALAQLWYYTGEQHFDAWTYVTLIFIYNNFLRKPLVVLCNPRAVVKRLWKAAWGDPVSKNLIQQYLGMR